jgi:hypothetical protein
MKARQLIVLGLDTLGRPESFSLRTVVLVLRTQTTVSPLWGAWGSRLLSGGVEQEP